MPSRLYMGLRPTHRDESHRLRHPCASSGPRQDNELDSRFRGNDVAFDGRSECHSKPTEEPARLKERRKT
jgi:hypothetical protein